jgi:hypothetical protein
MLGRAIALVLAVAVSTLAGAQTPPAPLVLEAKILLGQVNGRIDHLAIDLKCQRLFVAELGNDSLICGEWRNGLCFGAARPGFVANRAHRPG